MKTRTWIGLLACASLVTATLLLGTRTNAPSARQDSATSQPAAEPVVCLPFQKELATSTPATMQPPARKSGEAVSVSVRDILPELLQPVTDWRTYRPQRLVIAPHRDTSIAFSQASVREENGRTIWTGRNGEPGAFLATAATEHEWHAILAVPGADTYEFHISGQAATVTQTTDNGLCANDVSHGTPVETDGTPGSAVAEADTVTHTADVLYFYDAAVLAAVGTSASLDTRFASRIESANLALANSLVTNFRWRYVGAYQAPAYTTTGKLEDDLNKMTYSNNALGQFVAQKTTLHGVDQAVLYVSGDRDFAGIAWVPGNHAALMWTNTSYMTMAHEMAHNVGCFHDRQTQQESDENNRHYDGNNRYYYGFAWDSLGSGTIMSYAKYTRVPYFSNPNVTYNGIALGVPKGEPRAAFNAATITENAVSLANEDSLKAPVIITQPQAASISAGGGFTLSVTAIGAAPTYQWRKAGAAISGATGTSFAVSNATTADAGSYDVIVANAAGQAFSAAATVTVNGETGITTPPITPPTTTNTSNLSSNVAPASSGGGGGGGAISTPALIALALLTLVRGCSQSRIAPARQP